MQYNRIKELIDKAEQENKKISQIVIEEEIYEREIERETVMGKELDELIYAMRPGITLPADPTAKTTSERAADSGKESQSPGEAGSETEAKKETEADTEDEKTSADVENTQS
mgnify:CR=1 FL=1